MKKLLSISITFIFLIWILPLGAFIAPAKEGLACAGQRAICLCSHLLAKAQNGIKAKQLIINSSAPQKENTGAENLYLFPSLNVNHSPGAFHLAALEFKKLPHQIFNRSIEQVPKA